MYEGEPCDRLMLLLSGRVKITRVIDNGYETLLGIRDPGEFFGEVSHIDGDVRVATVTALEPVEVLVIASSVLAAHVERTPELAFALLQVLARRFRETTLIRSQICASDTMGRLAARLIELVDRYGEPCDGGVEVMLPLSRDELTAWTGGSRAGVAKALQTLRELGWIETQHRRIVVRDAEALRARAA